ncbi:MAG: hypothetical protein AVDCRST_MAG35-2518 [uncultured Quadrisphaera sp.]|uniref:Superoxide dismutase n=1 Tax=uncultured Quadrisphaera sp. TaxID=904978 RepID=A0A6J4PZ93_9ACTN|nr:MAG: hypothetical protein AVDCRST_MAG35-2518 [uncultured Quadrisphaera sp.]
MTRTGTTRTAASAVLALSLLSAGLAPAASAAPSGATAASSAGVVGEIPLPAGFAPEDLARGRGSSFYVGSLSGAGIFAGDLRTGDGRTLVPGAPGRTDAGLFVDRRNRLWVAGAAAGDVRVYDATTGEALATYQIEAEEAFTTDVVVTEDAAYVTDSNSPRLYVIPLRGGRDLPEPSAVRVVPLTGDISYTDQPNAFNVNGIVAARGRLLVGQLNTGLLFLVDPDDGRTHQVDLDGATVFGADGLTLQGRTLYVTQNIPQRVAVVELDDDLSSGRVVQEVSDARFDVPTSNTVFGGGLYVLNSRVLTPPTPTTPYSILRFDRP